MKLYADSVYIYNCLLTPVPALPRIEAAMTSSGPRARSTFHNLKEILIYSPLQKKVSDAKLAVKQTFKIDIW